MRGEALVLVPGLNCTSALFASQIEALGRDRDIMVADHTLDETMEAMAARLLAGAPERFALAGLSMGGYVALAVIRQAPGRVTRLGLLDTNARADAPAAKPNREELMALAQSGRFDEVHDALWPRLVHPDRRGDIPLERTVRGMMVDTGAGAFVRQQRAIIGRSDSRDRLATIAVPTLVLVGADDVLTPPEQATEMADLIPGASLAIVPHCGHLSSLERPAAVTEALAGWLAA